MNLYSITNNYEEKSNGEKDCKKSGQSNQEKGVTYEKVT